MMAPAEKKVTEKAKTTKQSLKTEVKQCLNKKEKEKETVGEQSAGAERRMLRNVTMSEYRSSC